MRIAGIVRDSIVDGIGIRDTIFFQGCPHRCKGCHNPQTWDYDGGEEISITEILDVLSNSSNDITISGGEPLEQFDELLNLLEAIRKTTNKRVWLYTGYVFDFKLSSNIYALNLLSNYVDVLIDGKFIESLKGNYQFKGSDNQRLIDLPRSVKENKIILWEEHYGEV